IGKLFDIVQVDNCIFFLEGHVPETSLRKPPLERSLSTFKGWSFVASGAGFLSFMSLGSSLSVSGTHSPAYSLGLFFAARGRRQIIDFHYLTFNLPFTVFLCNDFSFGL